MKRIQQICFIILGSTLFGLGTMTASAQSIDTQIAQASSGNAQAQYDLGMCYRTGRCGQIDYQLALTWLQRAADQNLAEAQLRLGEIYMGEYGIAANRPLAFQWLIKSAQQGNGKAQYQLWQAYSLGIGINDNEKIAEAWGKKAKLNLKTIAEKGDPEAQFDLYWLDLATSYVVTKNGEKQAVPLKKDYKGLLREAKDSFQKLAESGDAEAMIDLQAVTAFAPYTKHANPDDNLGMASQLKAAEKGQVGAQYFVGFMAYEMKDYETASKYLLLAAGQNYAKAQMSLGFYYLDGRGFQKNVPVGLNWIGKAAENDISEAQLMLGHIYSGLYPEYAVLSDSEKALLWYQKAALHGNALAMLRLAVIYAEGAIVDKDLIRARAWEIKTNEVINAHSSTVLQAVSYRDGAAKLDVLHEMSVEQERAAQQQAKSIQFIFP